MRVLNLDQTWINDMNFTRRKWRYRGQVLRVAGYDDGETTDEEDQELPVGHCSVFWLGHYVRDWWIINRKLFRRIPDRFPLLSC